MKRRIVLASSSPRRRDLLGQIGIEFEVSCYSYVEPDSTGREPLELVLESSRQKAQSAIMVGTDALIIGADTIIEYNGKIIGKPHDKNEASRILNMISGREHRVITGFTLLDTRGGESVSQAVTTRVFMKKMTRAEIDSYVDTGEPLDKAGAYAIQERGAILVKKIIGDYSNVVGLPLHAVAAALEKFGVKVLKPGTDIADEREQAGNG